MDSEARGIFQGSRCLPDKQCKCSTEGLLFSNTGCKAMQASRQGACKHLSRQWLCSGFQQYIDEQFNSPEQLAKSALALYCATKTKLFLYLLCVSCNRYGTFKSWLIRCKFILPETVWESVLLHSLLVADSRLALGRFPELSLVVCPVQSNQSSPSVLFSVSPL